MTEQHGKACHCEICQALKDKLSSWRPPAVSPNPTIICCCKCKAFVGVIGYTMIDSLVVYCVGCARELGMLHMERAGEAG